MMKSPISARLNHLLFFVMGTTTKQDTAFVTLARVYCKAEMQVLEFLEVKKTDLNEIMMTNKLFIFGMEILYVVSNIPETVFK